MWWLRSLESGRGHKLCELPWKPTVIWKQETIFYQYINSKSCEENLLTFRSKICGKMDRVSRGVRRGGVKIMSGLTGGNHSDLNLLISEIKDVRSGGKTFMTAQNSAAQHLLKWGANENRAIQDVSSQLCEINTTWTEVMDTAKIVMFSAFLVACTRL